MCGEQALNVIFIFPPIGSPPRVRGTDRRKVESAVRPVDHPRVCGEQISRHLGTSGQCGSPPRVRGTVLAVVTAVVQLRITPACAGNRGAATRCNQTAPDHPRVCGEQHFESLQLCPISGSPPRVRGTGIRQCGYIAPIRITPACAGNSARGQLDHPP